MEKKKHEGFLYTLYNGGEKWMKQTKMGWWNPRGEFSSSSQVDHEKSHLEALARWNVVLWRFTFFRAIEETDFQMITTDYFFFLMIVGKFCCVLIKEEKFIYVVTIALIMNAWRLIWLDRWIIDNFNILLPYRLRQHQKNKAKILFYKCMKS